MNKVKIEKMVSAYNNFAVKHDYPNISVDYEDKKIIGEFVPKDDNKYNGIIGFFKNANIAGNNASLKADYNKIKKELKKDGN